MPFCIDRAAGSLQAGIINGNRLHAVPIIKFPIELLGIDKMSKPRMKRIDMVILQITFDEGFPITVIVIYLNPIQYMAGKIKVFQHAEFGHILRHIPRPII